MNDEITLHQVIIRFHEPDNSRDDHIPRLADFTNYDGLISVLKPIDAINVDIRSYCYDHERIREALNRFIDNVSFALGVRCKMAIYAITYSSKDVVGWMANEPIRDVIYTIEILK